MQHSTSIQKVKLHEWLIAGWGIHDCLLMPHGGGGVGPPAAARPPQVFLPALPTALQCIKNLHVVLHARAISTLCKLDDASHLLQQYFASNEHCSPLHMDRSLPGQQALRELHVALCLPSEVV